MNKSQKENITILNYVNKFLMILFIISIFFVSLISLVFSNTYDLGKYDTRFEKFSVYEKFPKEIALEKTQNIISFFDSEQELDRDFFKQDEITHLEEVKNLLSRLKILYFIFIFLTWFTLIVLAYINKKNYFNILSDLFFYSGIFILLILLILVIAYFVIGFDVLFWNFHEIFFIEKFAFDPYFSNMKSLFPDVLFFDIGRNIIIELVLEGILFLIVGLVVKKNKKIK